MTKKQEIKEKIESIRNKIELTDLMLGNLKLFANDVDYTDILKLIKLSMELESSVYRTYRKLNGKG